MGERSLRGSRLGSVSYETERNTAPIERQYAEYRCASGHLFTVPFADDAELQEAIETAKEKIISGEIKVKSS